MSKNVVEKLSKEMSVEKIKSELKRIQSVKCRLLKQKSRKDYNDEMTKVLTYEQNLKEARSLLEPKKLTVTTMTENDIKVLDLNETIKAIKSIQSKKCLTKYDDDQQEYENACLIEKMLLEHKSTMIENDHDKIKKSDIKTIVETLENNSELTKESVLELLKKYI